MCSRQPIEWEKRLFFATFTCKYLIGFSVHKYFVVFKSMNVVDLFTNLLVNLLLCWSFWNCFKRHGSYQYEACLIVCFRCGQTTINNIIICHEETLCFGLYIFFVLNERHILKVHVRDILTHQTNFPVQTIFVQSMNNTQDVFWWNLLYDIGKI